MKFLTTEEFANVVSHTKLLALDLIVTNDRGQFLLGKRVNPPAKGLLFVPGGRIHKGETWQESAHRICQAELSQDVSTAHIKVKGLYDHIYNDNFMGNTQFSTEYAVIACCVDIQVSSFRPPLTQHSDYKWLSAKEILISPDVHPYSKSYFIDNPDNCFIQFF